MYRVVYTRCVHRGVHTRVYHQGSLPPYYAGYTTRVASLLTMLGMYHPCIYASLLCWVCTTRVIPPSLTSQTDTTRRVLSSIFRVKVALRTHRSPPVSFSGLFRADIAVRTLSTDEGRGAVCAELSTRSQTHGNSPRTRLVATFLIKRWQIVRASL